ncbi:MAG TPA: PTS sugar transporter subunit IIA [Planctomycetota bacterium]|nr:PTS sugar transporter subunit IIA [Planctomycetota bacterium]
MKRLADYLSRDRILLLKSPLKEDALNTLVDVIASTLEFSHREDLRSAIFEREKILSTGIGLGIAVPHAKIAGLKDFVLAAGISHEGINFDSLDRKPVHIILMIAGPAGEQQQYLQILARATLLLKNAATRKAILAAENEGDIHRLVAENSRP